MTKRHCQYSSIRNSSFIHHPKPVPVLDHGWILESLLTHSFKVLASVRIEHRERLGLGRTVEIGLAQQFLQITIFFRCDTPGRISPECRRGSASPSERDAKPPPNEWPDCTKSDTKEREAHFVEDAQADSAGRIDIRMKEPFGKLALPHTERCF